MSQPGVAPSTGGGGGRHWTTRRGFISAGGFAVISLYAIWAAYGAAPIRLSSVPSAEGHGGADHGGGMHGGGGISPDMFRRMTEAFIDANELPDGSVRPTREGMARMAAALGDGKMAQAAAPGDEGETHGKEDAHGVEPIDAYLTAQRYYYEPSEFRLERNVPYRFRMMAMDTAHGGSILGGASLGGHIMRLPTRKLAETTMAFAEAGEYLIYCTVYCGEGHDTMQGKIIVA